MPREFTKRQRKVLRELAGKAHEREIRRHLEKLHAAFERWRSGEMETWDLSDAIHRFHQGPNRELFNRYDTRGMDHFLVARAIAAGLLQNDEVPAELQGAIASDLEYFQRGLADGSISFGGED
jgi:hypothetical protein